MIFWSLCVFLLLLTAALLLRYTHAGVPTAQAHGLAQRLGLSGRRSVILVVGCSNALVLLGVLGWFGWSTWRDQHP